MKKVYMIGNTHFDPVWLWKWDEAMSSILATFRSALERMREYPEFKYSFAAPPVFEWVRRTAPEMFEEIRKRVEEGRWELAEGWWVQADCYSASGESYVRQGLYGQRYLKEHFGRYANTVFNIDSFGHSPMLPQILKQAHIQYYCLCRPESRHIELESPLFRWRSKDGSEVLAFRADNPYQKEIAKALDEAEAFGEELMVVYGVTDHGGAPTIAAIEEIKRREAAVFATVTEYFADRNTDMVVERELLTGDFGPYCNHNGIKARNRAAEYAALNAEKASVIAGDYDKAALRGCWQDILFNQFHDILGGASIRAAYTDAENLYGRAIATAEEIMHLRLQRITNRIQMPGQNPDSVWNLVIWNLNGADYEGYIEAEVQWAHEFEWYDKGIALEDSEGNRIDCQIIQERSVIPRFRSRFVFKAGIPAMGYKVFKVIQTGQEPIRIPRDEPARLETERYVFRLSQERGGLESVWDKRQGRELLQNLLIPVCFADDGDTWCFNIKEYGEQAEPFQLEGLEVIESGSLRAVVKGSYTFRNSVLEMYYTFYETEDYIDVAYRINWREKHMVCKLLLPVSRMEHRAAVPYGSVERTACAADMPMGEWLETSEFALFADHIFAYNMTDNILGLTLLRSPIYGDLRIKEIDLNTDYDIMEQGISEGKLRLVLGRNAMPEETAALWSNAPVVLVEANHNGTLPPAHSYCRLDAQSVSLIALKQCEDDDGMIIRCVEYGGQAHTAKLTVFGQTYTFEIGAYEILSLKLKDYTLQKVYITEDEQEE